MHRQSPLTAAFVGYSSGGCRSLVDAVDDERGMQEMKGSMLHGESRERVESPQNYGFTSVVLPAKKGKDGQIEECAEAYINYMGGNRSFPVAAVMDDRRHRPWALKPGENAQYDDLGQMTLMRRTGLYLLTTDNPDESQQQGGGGASAATREEGGGGGGQQVERMVSLRHVEKKKQERPKKKSEGGESGGSNGGVSAGTLAAEGGSGDQSNGKDHKHEGETVNTEIRATKKKIEILDGETVVAVYSKEDKSWTFKTDKMNWEFKEVNLKATETMTIECDGKFDIKGKPIVFNDGTPTSPPFQVPG